MLGLSPPLCVGGATWQTSQKLWIDGDGNMVTGGGGGGLGSRSKLYQRKQTVVTATLQASLFLPCPSSNLPSLLFLTWGLAASIQMEGLFLFLFVYLFMHPAIRGIAGAFVPPQNANRHGG